MSFLMFTNPERSHHEARRELSRFLKINKNSQWLLEAYSLLQISNIQLETHANIIALEGTWGSYFDAFVCGLIFHLDITMITTINQ